MKKENSITDQDLRELGIPKQLFEDWYRCMGSIFNHFTLIYGDREFRQKKGSLIFRDWIIRGDMVNDSYVEIVATKGDIEMITIRYHNNLPALIHSLETIIKSI